MDQELQAIAAMRTVIQCEPVPERIFSAEEAKSILRSSGWSAESAARVLGVSGRTVQGWLADAHQPSAPVADRWAKLLACLDRASAVRSNRIALGVARLIEVVRSTPVPTYSETAA